jgi:hypothetical protein
VFASEFYSEEGSIDRDHIQARDEAEEVIRDTMYIQQLGNTWKAVRRKKATDGGRPCGIQEAKNSQILLPSGSEIRWKKQRDKANQ